MAKVELTGALPFGGDGASPVRALGRLLGGAAPFPDTDWEAVLALARPLHLAPLLYYQLATRWQREAQAVCDAGAPPANPEKRGVALTEEQARELRREFHRASARWMATSQQISEALAALTAAGIPALVVKGPAVGAFYPRPELRTYCDLDLCVPEDRLAQAATALKEQGYRPHASKTMPLHGHPKHLPPLVRDGARLSVELHWQVDDPEKVGRLPVKELWERAVPWAVGGQRTLRLEAVDAVLYLSRHAVVDDLARWALRASCDVAQVTTGWGRAEWESLVQRAEAYGLARAVYLMLLLQQQLLGSPVPGEAMDRLCALCQGPLPPERLAPFLEALPWQVFATVDKPARGLGRGSLPARFRYVCTNVFLPREVLASYYNLPATSPRLWLLYLRRLVRLVRDYARVLGTSPPARKALRREVWLQRWLSAEEGG